MVLYYYQQKDLDSQSPLNPVLEEEDLNWSKLIEPGINDISIEKGINVPQELNVLEYL